MISYLIQVIIYSGLGITFYDFGLWSFVIAIDD